MDNGWSIVLSSDDLAFIQKVHRYYDMYHDMKAEWSYALCCLKEHHLKDLHNFQPFTSSDDSSLFFYGSFASINSAGNYLKSYCCIVCYDASEHLNDLAELCSKMDLNKIYAFSQRKEAEYFTELALLQYACDQLIGIDNSDIRDCLASDAENIRLLRQKSIVAYDERYENIHRALLYVKSNYKGLYDFTVIFEDMYKLMPKLEECLLMAFFNNPLFKDEQGIVYVEKTI